MADGTVRDEDGDPTEQDRAARQAVRNERLAARKAACTAATERPSWAPWLAMPHVELWEAVALSLDIEPDSSMRDEARHGVRDHSRRRRLPEEFFRRVSFCLKCLTASGPIRPQGPLFVGMLNSWCRVLLAEVAGALSKAGLDLPSEMSALLDSKPVESKEAREDRRLKACEDAGLNMPVSHLGRLPDGIGKLAEDEGVSRQTFTLDVKAAIQRRAGNHRAGR